MSNLINLSGPCLLQSHHLYHQLPYSLPLVIELRSTIGVTKLRHGVYSHAALRILHP